MKKSVPILAMSALLLASACRPATLYFVGPEGPSEYRLGWEDGWDTGMAAEGGPIYKMMYGFKKRPEQNDNDLYKLGWNEGFTYCRFTLSSKGGSFF